MQKVALTSLAVAMVTAYRAIDATDCTVNQHWVGALPYFD